MKNGIFQKMDRDTGAKVIGHTELTKIDLFKIRSASFQMRKIDSNKNW